MTILSEREASPKEIAVELGLTKAKAGYVSKHVKQLAARGLVELVRVAPVRGVKEHFYRASVAFTVSGDEAEQMTLDERLTLSSWTISCINRDFLRAVKSKTIDGRIDRHLTRFPLLLDERAIRDLFEMHDRAYQRVQEIRPESDERRSISGDEATPFSAIFASFVLPSGPHGNERRIGTDQLSSVDAGEALKATERILRRGWHPIQIQALTILSEREASPKQIAVELGLTRNKAGVVSYHVKELLKRGQVELVRTVAVRGANEHFYRASVPLVVMGEDAEMMTLEQRLILSSWTISCINQDFLHAVESKTIDERTDRHLTRAPLLLDEKGVRDVLEVQRRAFYRTQDIQSESDQRRCVSGDRPTPISAVMAGFTLP